MDQFDKAREAIEGVPGFQAKRSTVVAKSWSLLPAATWIVEVVRTDDSSGIFLQTISAEGSQRIAIPHSVAEAIFRQYHAIIRARRKIGAKKAVVTRKQKEAQRKQANSEEAKTAEDSHETVHPGE